MLREGYGFCEILLCRVRLSIKRVILHPHKSNRLKPTEPVKNRRQPRVLVDEQSLQSPSGRSNIRLAGACGY